MVHNNRVRFDDLSVRLMFSQNVPDSQKNPRPASIEINPLSVKPAL
jgi:hypothetical protein